MSVSRVTRHLAKASVSTMLLLCAAWAHSAGFADCLLRKLPGLSSDAAAQAAFNICLEDYPGGFDSVRQGDGRGLFSFRSGDQCAFKKAASTQSRRAGQLIFSACRKLYDKVSPYTADGPPVAPATPPFPSPPPQSAAAQAEPDRQPPAPSAQPDEAIRAHYARIYAAHPDASAIYAQEAFTRWIQRTPKYQSVIDHGSSDQIIEMFSAYKKQLRTASGRSQVSPKSVPTPQSEPPRQCVLRPIMTDEDYRACGANPPRTN
jgi:hypothetical protein